MKAFRIITLCIVMAMSLSGCKKEYITEEHITKEYITEEYVNYGAQITTYTFDIDPNEWHESTGDEGNYLYVSIDIDDIDNEVMANGIVLSYVYFIYNVAENAGSWNMLPYVYPYSYTQDFQLYNVTENIRMDYELGRVTFIREDMDGQLPEATANTYTFRVCVVKDAQAQ